MATILKVIQDQVVPLLGLAVPTAVMGSDEREHQELRTVINKVVDDLTSDSQSYEWEQLRIEGTFTGNGVSTAFVKPADFRKLLKDGELWSVALQRPLSKVLRSDDWMVLKIRNTGIITGAWHMTGGSFEIYPTLALDEEVRFVYMSNFVDFARTKTILDDDTDEFILDDRLLAKGVVWRWKQFKGLPYAEEMEDYNSALRAATEDDGGSTVLVVGSSQAPNSNDYHGQTIIDTR